ncbi:MAG: hypothetical protein B7C24_03655 [Bacteroidetes bacterium 4572_77]|nr:MAG: hypothetical protein B7C24_03655 [Bacteroidetes bacterium 4572_77]
MKKKPPLSRKKHLKIRTGLNLISSYFRSPGLYLQMPNGENRAANHSLRVKDNEYNNLGVSTSQGFELKTPLREKMSINEGGIINAEIVLHSGHYDNYGMVSFELEVVED